MVPALQQPVLLTIHVGTAALAYAVSGVAFLAAVAEIAQVGAGDRIGGLPSASVSRAVGHRAVLIAFPILTVAIALGSVSVRSSTAAPTTAKNIGTKKCPICVVVFSIAAR